MKQTAFCGKIKKDYAAFLNNTVNSLVAKINKMNFYGCFPICVHIWQYRFVKG
jgi:hypothetical protein